MKNLKELTFIFLILSLHLVFGLWMSRNMLFFYSRVEFAWKMFHGDFFKNLFVDFIPPGYYFITGALAQITPFSIGFWQKFVDLLSGDLIIAFVTVHALYKKNINWIYPLILGVFCFGLLTPLTLQGGEAVVALPVILGLWCLSKKRYILFALLFAFSIWFKFLQIFVFPAVGIYLLIRYIYYKPERRLILVSILIILLSFGLYVFLDNATGLRFQLYRSKSLSFGYGVFDNLITFVRNIASYSFIVFLSLPFAFFGKKLLSINIYISSALCTLVAISIFGIGPYYVYPVIALMYVGVFMSKKVKIPPTAVLFSVLFGIIIMQTNPLVNIFHGSNQTKQEKNRLINEINKNYHGGVVVIPFDFALEFPFRHYLLDGLPTETEGLNQIEYVFTPDGLVPDKIVKNCHLTYSSRIENLILYKTKCGENYGNRG